MASYSSGRFQPVLGARQVFCILSGDYDRLIIKMGVESMANRITIGDIAPDFTLKDNRGSMLNLVE